MLKYQMELLLFLYDNIRKSFVFNRLSVSVCVCEWVYVQEFVDAILLKPLALSPSVYLSHKRC